MSDIIALSQRGGGFDAAAFEKPEAALSPYYAWVWNAPIDRCGIVSRLEAMLDAGIRAMYILPEPPAFRPDSMKTSLSPEYLSDKFFELARFAAEYALGLGMVVWLYDEGGWPSGTACGRVLAENPNVGLKRLAAREADIAPGEAYSPASAEGILAAFDSETGARIAPGEASAKARVCVEYFVERAPSRHLTDLLDAETCDIFINATHERYYGRLGDLFGARVSAMFTDEPCAGRFPWPRGFAEAFGEEYGYDARDYLPVIFERRPASSEAETRARQDYREFAAKLFKRNYFDKIGAWCAKRGLLSTGHLDIDHLSDGCLAHNYGATLPMLRALDIPGVDVIWRQIFRPKGERASCPEGNGFFPRFAASAARQAGRNLAISESFAIYGAGLNGDDMRYVINFQLARGVNLFNFMSVSYSKAGAIPMAMRPQFIPEAPGYGHLTAINDYVARACYIMSLGEAGGRAALYFPARDIWAGGEARAAAVAAFDALGRRLEREQIDFDIIDDEAALEPRTLSLYARVYIPKCRYMPLSVRAALSSLRGDVEPVVETDCPHIRARRRDFEGGSAYFLYNESGETVEANIGLGRDGYVYELNLWNGRVKRAALPARIALSSGEERVYLATDAQIPARSDAARGPSMEIAGFQLSKAREFFVTPDGVSDKRFPASFAPVELGGWAKYLGGDFSGEAVYRARVELPDAPDAEAEYMLSLGKVDFSARAYIDGRAVGTVMSAPMKLYISGRELPRSGAFTLDIEVANTAANRLLAEKLENMFPASELGPYHERMLPFEEESKGGGLYGPVTISRLS